MFALFNQRNNKVVIITQEKWASCKPGKGWKKVYLLAPLA